MYKNIIRKKVLDLRHNLKKEEKKEESKEDQEA